MNKKGFATLYILMILASLLVFLLVVIEGTAGYAIRSRAEGACLLAGTSVLSEYQKALWSRYGLFCVTAHEGRLSQMAEYYIVENLEVEGSKILSVDCIDCIADPRAYPALDSERFASQLRYLAAATKAWQAWQTMTGLPDTMFEALDESGDRKRRLDEHMEALQERMTPESGEAAPAERIRLSSLIRRWRDMQKPLDGSGMWNKRIPSGSERKNLPSVLLEAPGAGSLLGRRSLPDADAWLESAYIIQHCSYATAVQSANVLDLEAEYILYGEQSDEENARRMRNDLFLIRSALNLAFMAGDAQKRSEVSAISAPFAAWIPLPLAEFIVASLWAGMEALHDVERLWSGGSVPFMKTPADWYTDWQGGIRPPDSAPDEREKAPGRYEDYASVLLSITRAEGRRARLMDVMQLNIRKDEAEPFVFMDYAYGFDLSVQLDKRMRCIGLPFGSTRSGVVEQTHVYR